MKRVVNGFRVQYQFLNTFHKAPFTYQGLVFNTVEGAFQSSKTDDRMIKLRLRLLKGFDAKIEGQKLKTKKDWEKHKVSIMKEILYAKFSQDPNSKQLLLGTGEDELIHENWWKDTFWGTHKGQGLNLLGKLLMDIREQLKNENRIFS